MQQSHDARHPTVTRSRKSTSSGEALADPRLGWDAVAASSDPVTRLRFLRRGDDRARFGHRVDGLPRGSLKRHEAPAFG